MLKKISLLFVLLFVSTTALAEPPTGYYRVSKFSCLGSTGYKLNYDASVETNIVTSQIGVFNFRYWIDGFTYTASKNKSEIRYTGHRPSAGPVLDFWESDYSIHFEGELPLSPEYKAEARVYRSTAFGPWIFVSTVKCIVSVDGKF